MNQDNDKDVEAAWEEEIQKRLEEIDTGKARLIPWSEARRMILEDTEELGET